MAVSEVTLRVGEERAQWWRPLVGPLTWYLGSRVFVLVIAALAVALGRDVTASRLLSAWDASYFLALIESGYPGDVPIVDGHAAASPLAFFPLYPLTARLVVWMFHLPATVAAIGVSMLFGAIAVVVVRRLALELTDETTADRAAVLFCLFPGSVVFSTAYSESLMITLAAACLWALLRERWLMAGVTAALATATRPNAVALIVACGWAAATAISRRGGWRPLAAPLLAPLGILSFFAFLRWHTGESGVWFRVQEEGWNQSFDFGINTLKTLNNFILDPLGDSHRLVNMAVLGLTLALCVVLLRRRLPGLVTAYTMVIVALATASTIDIVRPRALLTAFPLVIALAASLKRSSFVCVTVISATGLAALAFFPFWASP